MDCDAGPPVVNEPQNAINYRWKRLLNAFPAVHEQLEGTGAFVSAPPQLRLTLTLTYFIQKVVSKSNRPDAFRGSP